MENIKDKLFCVVGLGSIGRRHLKNLATLGCHHLIAVSRSTSSIPEEPLPKHRVYESLDIALQEKPFAVIVCNPTIFHLSAATKAAKAGCHIFMEKPIAQLAIVEPLKEIIEKKQLIFQTGFQLRFHPVLQQIKAIIEEKKIGRILTARAHWGEYLPDWHPWENYKQSYSAQKSLGGGVLLTLSHPFDYLYWFFGAVDKVQAVSINTGHLGIDVEEIATAIIKFKNNVLATVYLDYFEKPKKHIISITASEGKIEWDNEKGEAYLFNSAHPEGTLLSPPKDFVRNDLFLDEMNHFLSCLSHQKQPDCNLNDGITNIQLIEAIKKAARTEQTVRLKKVAHPAQYLFSDNHLPQNNTTL